jgi:hypothetical protein
VYSVANVDRQREPCFLKECSVRCSSAMRAHSGVVAQLLNNNEYHIEFQGFLTNHVKHAVVALAGLDAPDAVIKKFWDQCALSSACRTVHLFRRHSDLGSYHYRVSRIDMFDGREVRLWLGQDTRHEARDAK